MAFPSADGGADSASGGRGHAGEGGAGAGGACSGGRGHAPGHPGEGGTGAYSGGRGHARGHTGEGGTGAGGAYSGGRGHAPGHTTEGYSWARPWEAPGPNPGRPLRWFSRLAVAMRVRPDLSMWRGYTPTGIQTVHVKLTPLQIKRAEINQVKQELDDLLKEFQIKLRTPAEFDANSSVTVQQPWTGVILKSGIAIAVFMASMKRPGAIQVLWEVGSNAVDAAMRYESENDQYVRLIQEFTLNMNAIIEYALENEEITAEYAKDLLNVVDKYDTIVSMLLARDGSRFFSLNVLKTMLQLPPSVASLADKLRAFGSAFQALTSLADVAYRVSQSVGDPALFEDIGKEATDITGDHFLLNKVHLDAMQKYSVTFGSEIVGENLLKKMMLNVRNSDLSICLSASEVDPGQAAEPNDADVNLYNPNFAELYVEKLFADNIKGMLHIPYSLRNSKLELQSLHPFQSISGCIGLNRKRKPCLSLSSYWGVKDLKLHNVESLGFGGKLQINDGDSWINCSAGVSVSSLWCNLGLTFKQPGLFTATCSSRMGNPSTVLGGYISYSYEEDRTKFAAGVLHSVDNSMYLKSCIGSDKVLSGVVSKSFGKSRLNLVAEVDLKDFWKLPRAGLYFSFP